VSTQNPEEFWNCLIVKMGVSQLRIMADRKPPANEHRPQPQVETATARCHSSHHNDSQTVFWFAKIGSSTK
jgi:hypothetical protein